MPVPESRSIELERFLYWMRTGLWVTLDPDPPETKFNPYHDPANGRFTFAPGGAGGGTKPASRPTPKPSNDGPLGKNHVVKLGPLSAAEQTTYNSIMATSSVRQAMNEAGNLSDEDGHERGFFIYYDGQRYSAGDMKTGTTGELPGLDKTLVRPNVLTGEFRHVVAVYHTHPGDYENVGEADNYDQNFGKWASNSIIIIRSKQGKEPQYIYGK